MLGRLLCRLGLHKKIAREYDGGTYAHKVRWHECARPGCSWQSSHREAP